MLAAGLGSRCTLFLDPVDARARVLSRKRGIAADPSGGGSDGRRKHASERDARQGQCRPYYSLTAWRRRVGRGAANSRRRSHRPCRVRICGFDAKLIGLTNLVRLTDRSSTERARPIDFRGMIGCKANRIRLSGCHPTEGGHIEQQCGPYFRRLARSPC